MSFPGWNYNGFKSVINKDYKKVYTNDFHSTSIYGDDDDKLPQINSLFGLKILTISNVKKQIEQIDNLPDSLEELYCYDCNIPQLNNLPINLKILHCNRSKITTLDYLPQNLKILDCLNNNLIDAINKTYELKQNGFSGVDIISNAFYVLKLNISNDMSDDIKIKLLYVISEHLVDISKTIDTDVQLTGFLVALTGIK